MFENKDQQLYKRMLMSKTNNSGSILIMTKGNSQTILFGTTLDWSRLKQLKQLMTVKFQI